MSIKCEFNSNGIFSTHVVFTVKLKKISALFSFSLLAQRILNQVQHRRQQKKVRF